MTVPASNLNLKISGNTAVLRWTGTAGVQYQAQGATGLGGVWQAIGSPTTDFAVTNLLTGPVQFFRVAIYTNTPEYMANAAKSAGDTAPPTLPTGLAGSAASCNQVSLSWNASTDVGTKVGGTTYTSGLKGYNVYRGGVFLMQVLAPSTTATDTSVSGSTTYSYAVSAIDNAGNSSSRSSAVNVTTPACATCTATITTSASPAAGGTVSGGGTVNCGSGLAVTALANSGYSFASWTENGSVVSSSASYSFTANANRNLVANFNAVSVGTLSGCWSFDTANVSGTTVTDSSGSGNNATLAGNPLPTIVAGKTNQAVNLDGVSDLVSVADSASLDIKGAFTVAAWVNFNALPGSSQYPNIVAKLNSPSSCYGYGIYWSGSGVSGIVGSGSPSWTSVGPGYTPAVGVWNHYVVVFDGANLKLYVNGALYSQTAASAPGDTAGIPVKMGAHYNNPAAYGYVNGKLDDARIYSRALSATEVTSLYNSAGSGSGSVVISSSSSPTAGGTTGGGGSFASGSSVTVTAYAGSCYTFMNWTENSTVVSTAASYTFTASANRNLVANFAQSFYSIGTSSSGGGTTTGGGTVACGSSVTVVATANSPYSFANWTENGNVVSTSASYNFTASANRTLVANFTQAAVAITTSASPAGSGTTSGGGSFNSGSSVTVTASANSGYSFSNWTENGTVVSTSASYAFTASASRNLVANFVSASGGGGGGVLEWVKNSTISSSGAQATVRGIAKDSSGNLIAVGILQGTVDFGSGPISSTGGAAFMAKYTGQGTLLWAKRLTANDLGTGAYGVAVDSQDNIVVTGVYSWTMDFGGGTTLSQHLDATGNSWGDMYVAKYSSSGGLLWARGYGGTGQDAAFSVAVDASGNIFLGGMINNSVTFDSVTLNAGYDDIALVKISATGSVLWAKKWGGANDDRAFSVAVDRSGDLLVTGLCSVGADLGAGPLSVAGMFLAKYSGVDGSYRWAKTFAGGTSSSVATDPNTGNVVFTGSLGGLTDLGGGALGPGGLFLAAYNSSGVYQWSKCFNVSAFSSTDSGYGVAVDGGGNITFTGQVATSPVSFDGMKGWYGGVNTFTASFTSSGAYRWATRASGSGQGIARAIAFDNSGHAVTGGTFSGTTDFGGIAVTAPAGSGPAFLGCYMQ